MSRTEELLRALVKEEHTLLVAGNTVCLHCWSGVTGTAILTEHNPSCPWRLVCELLEPPELTLTVTPREFDTILAALRFWQRALTGCGPIGEVPFSIQDIAAEHGSPLTTDEIDALCERINVGPKGATDEGS